MIENNNNLGSRLLSAAKYARKSAVFIDIGTDHAYLPIYLVAKGICRSAFAADVNDGPLERAEKNIASSSLSGKIAIVKSDGLRAFEGMDIRENADIAVLGMGGELIERIISESHLAKRQGTRLILQPMTHPEILRKSLLLRGFSIIGESVCLEGKIYQVICAEYTGICQSDYTDAELLVGKPEMAEDKVLFRELILHQKKVIRGRIEGKSMSAGDFSADKKKDEEIIRGLDEMLDSLNN